MSDDRMVTLVFKKGSVAWLLDERHYVPIQHKLYVEVQHHQVDKYIGKIIEVPECVPDIEEE